MSISSTNGLIGLSLLSGDTSVFGSVGSAAGTADIESLAVRKAKAQFTLAATTPPWTAAASTLSDSAQVATVKAMKTIIDASTAKSSTLPDDVKTSFVAYKALDSLRVLAQAAAATTMTDGQRAALQKSFAQGLDDLQTYMGTAPSSKLDLAFAQPTRRADSETLPPIAANTGTVTGTTVAKARDAALAGMTGSEQFTVAVKSSLGNASVHVDLAGTQQPPTLDSVASAINAAIQAIPAKNADGTVATDASGNPKPLYSVKFAPVKNSDGWTMGITAPHLEQVSITQDNAPDALMVSVGSSALDAPSSVRMLRFDDPANGGAQHSYATVTAQDADATARAALQPNTTVAVKGVTTPVPQVNASLTANASVTAPDGSTYVVGTAAGDVGGLNLAGSKDLLLTKRDSEGAVVWERMLGAAGSADGAAVSIASNGDVVVAGTVSGTFDTQNSDGDVLVSRYNPKGEEQWSTLVRASGADTATAITTAPDGSIYVGGKAGSGNGDAFVARLGSTGKLQERRLIDSGGSDGVNDLAVDGDGNVLALVRSGQDTTVRKLQGGALTTDLGQIDLGQVDARAIAVGADGTIAVGGATSTAVAGTQTNAISGGRDGFVTLLDKGLTSASTSYVGTGADDQIDSIAFDGGTLYAGGRTTGTLGATKTGTTDGFVVGIDTATGAVGTARQFGQSSIRTDSVQVSTAKGGASALGAIGLKLGVQGSQDSTLLTAGTSLRAGDEFSIQVEGGAVRKITIAANDTLTTLASRINLATGGKIAVTTPKVGTGPSAGNVLRIEAKAGASVELIAGADGKDALEKLGIPPKKLTVPDPVAANAPKVRPGGTYGLGLSDALGVGTAADAKVALGKITDAMSMTQTAYRSLYWDSNKAATVDGTNSTAASMSAYDKAKLASYTDALSRISALTATSSSGTTNITSLALGI